MPRRRTNVRMVAGYLIGVSQGKVLDSRCPILDNREISSPPGIRNAGDTRDGTGQNRGIVKNSRS